MKTQLGVRKTGNWPLVCQLIQKYSGMKPPRIEQVLGIGKNGSGRTWLTWLAGTRTPSQLIQNEIARRAVGKGWLKDLPDRLRQSLSDNTTNPQIAVLAEPDARLPFPLPYPPDEDEAQRHPNTASYFLLRDSQKAGKSSGASWRRCRLDPAWKSAVEAVHKILLDGEDESVVRAKLIAAYLRQTVSERS